jgi:hypothetical protein
MEQGIANSQYIMRVRCAFQRPLITAQCGGNKFVLQLSKWIFDEWKAFLEVTKSSFDI